MFIFFVLKQPAFMTKGFNLADFAILDTLLFLRFYVIPKLVSNVIILNCIKIKIKN